MSSDLARVRYFDRQYLRLEDFVDEQAYHLAAHRRHNLGLHRWGIVGGLRLLVDEGGQPYVEPGFALDGYGRDLVVDAARPVPLSAFDELASETIAVWLVYDRVGSDAAPRGWASCGTAGGEATFTRERERPRLVTEVPDPDLLDPRQPATVPEADRPFLPHRPPPDAVRDDWPVFLGLVTRTGDDPADRSYVADPAGRPYAGVVAASVAAPFDRERPRLLLGGDEASGAAFEVRVPDAAGDELVTALEIDAAGDLTAAGDVTVHGELAVEGGALELSRPLPAEGEAAPGGEEARPWRLYRHHQATAEEDAVPGEQLRVEMAEDGGEVVVGFFSAEEERFEPCLTVAADHTVTVHGDLVVEGGIEGPIESVLPRIVPGLSPDAARLVLASFQSGVAGAGGFLGGRGTAGGFVSRALAVERAPAADELAAALAGDAELRAAVATELRAADSAAADELAALLAGDGEG